MWIRHYFNLKHRHINKPSILVSGIVAFFALMLAIAPWSSFTPKVNTVQVSDQQAWTIIKKNCTECHSATPTSALFSSAPSGFMLDSIEAAKKQTEKIYTRAILTKDMPLGNMTNMSAEERKTLAIWIEDYQQKK